jgi:hypothetical protein
VEFSTKFGTFSFLYAQEESYVDVATVVDVNDFDDEGGLEMESGDGRISSAVDESEVEASSTSTQMSIEVPDRSEPNADMTDSDILALLLDLRTCTLKLVTGMLGSKYNDAVKALSDRYVDAAMNIEHYSNCGKEALHTSSETHCHNLSVRPNTPVQIINDEFVVDEEVWLLGVILNRVNA